MSQAKGNQRKHARTNRKEIQRRKNFHKMLWICAGCVILGISAGFLLGKFWLYPSYRSQKEESGYSQRTQDSSGLDNQDLQELNRQIEQETEQ